MRNGSGTLSLSDSPCPFSRIRFRSNSGLQGGNEQSVPLPAGPLDRDIISHKYASFSADHSTWKQVNLANSATQGATCAYHWWVNSILWSIIWESDYDMDGRRCVWHIRNIKVRFKMGVKQTMSSSTSDDDSRDVQTLLEILQNDPITENIAMELEGTFLARHTLRN